MLKPRKLFFWNNNDINPINYGFKKGFPAPRKSGNNTRSEKKTQKQQQKKKKIKIKREWKKKTYFFTCVRKTFVDQLLTRYPPFAPLAQVDEWKENPSPFSIQGLLSEFSQFMAAETLINFLSLTDNDAQTFLEGEENQCTKKKTESYVFSGFGNCISCGWERKSTGRFGRLPERFPLSARKKSINDNCNAFSFRNDDLFYLQLSPKASWSAWFWLSPPRKSSLGSPLKFPHIPSVLEKSDLGAYRYTLFPQL